MSRFSRFCTAAMLSLLIAVSGCASEPASTNEAALAAVYEAYPELDGRMPELETVERVVDGDTLALATGAKVRLIGVDTPEVHGKTDYYGKEASAFTKSLLDGREVWLFRDVSEADRYGRLLRYVFLPDDPLMVNERLVREGYARPATYPPDVAMAGRFVAAEQDARSAGAGLWAAEAEQAGGAGSSEEAPDQRAEAACADPQIKGNIRSDGERIYHIPGGASYERTKPEAWFCTEEEAEAAGFRAPR